MKVCVRMCLCVFVCPSDKHYPALGREEGGETVHIHMLDVIKE